MSVRDALSCGSILLILQFPEMSISKGTFFFEVAVPQHLIMVCLDKVVCNAVNLQETNKTDQERVILIASPSLKCLRYALNEKVVKEISFERLRSVRMHERRDDVLVDCLRLSIT